MKRLHLQSNENTFFLPSLAFSPDGQILAVGRSAPAPGGGLAEGTIELWDLRMGKLSNILRQSARTANSDQANRVGSISFSPDGKWLVGSDARGYVLWDLAAGKEKYRWTSSAASIEPGHSVGWSSNSGLLALPDMNADLKPFDSDHGIAVIDVATGQRTALFPARWDAERAVQISPDGKLLATTGSGEGVRLFDLAAQTNIFSDPVGNPMLAASFSPDGRYLVAGSGMGGALLIYEITYEGSKINVNKKGTSAQNIGAELHQVDFAPDGNRALASSRGGVALWDATNWTTFKNLPGCEGRLSRDGTRVALVREESSDIVELWDLDVLAKTMAFPAVHETAPSPAPPNEVTRRSGNMNECISNLRRIDAAKQIWALEKGKHNADTPTMDDLRPYLAGAVLVCPDGGVYTIGTVGEKPTCSIPGHVLH